jgi:hypothetical protein
MIIFVFNIEVMERNFEYMNENSNVLYEGPQKFPLSKTRRNKNVLMSEIRAAAENNTTSVFKMTHLLDRAVLLRNDIMLYQGQSGICILRIHLYTKESIYCYSKLLKYEL